jgi:hypothetical protein
MMLSTAHAGEAGERERTFARGLELLEHAKTPDEYRKAAAEFETMLADGYRNGGVLYNIGNAYMGAHDYGRAIAAYRKAKLFRPRDPYLDSILREAVTLAPGHLAESPPPFWSHVFFWTSWLSYPEKMQLAFLAWLLAAVLLAGGVLLRNRKLYGFSGVLVLTAILFSVDAGWSYEDVFHSRHAVVVQETVARKGNSAEYQPAFDQPLKDGAEFSVIERRGDWVLGHFDGIGDGWLQKGAVVE